VLRVAGVLRPFPRKVQSLPEIPLSIGDLSNVAIPEFERNFINCRFGGVSDVFEGAFLFL